jgi:DNA-binding transcriptional MerR regulator
VAKKDQYEAIAKQYYTEMQIPISGIAKRLNLTEKTLHTWKKEGKWDEERTNFLRAQYQCYGALYKLLHTLADNALREFNEDNNKIPDGKVLNFITQMSEKLPKLKAFENSMFSEQVETIAKTEEKEETPEDMSVKIAKKIDAKLHGDAQ